MIPWRQHDRFDRFDVADLDKIVQVPDLETLKYYLVSIILKTTNDMILTLVPDLEALTYPLSYILPKTIKDIMLNFAELHKILKP